MQGRQAGAVDITREMEEAGIEAFLDSYPDTGTGDFQDRRMVREIFTAMMQAGNSRAAQSY